TLGRTYLLAEDLESVNGLTQALHLRGNQMEQLGAFLAEQTALSELKILLLYATEDDEPLAQLPHEIGKLKQLEHLDLHGNDQINLPPSLDQLRELRVLKLDHCGLQAVPEEIGTMSQLEWLDLNYNRITSFADVFDTLFAIYYIDLSFNPNTEPLPASLWRCLGLEKLYLNDLGLSELDEAVGGLIHLQTLSLNYNALRSLPD
ncbi:MAG: leucine-rich repeat domain-containing protein, partial [Bacteroidota bacterium]